MDVSLGIFRPSGWLWLTGFDWDSGNPWVFKVSVWGLENLQWVLCLPTPPAFPAVFWEFLIYSCEEEEGIRAIFNIKFGGWGFGDINLYADSSS